MSCSFRSSITVAAVVALAGLVGLGAVCEELFGMDKEPPECRMIQPTDSSAVSGMVTIRADAFDSSGVKDVRFYLSGSEIANITTPPYVTSWDAGNEPNESWHTIFCLATDIYDNVGSSDTVRVQVLRGGQRDVFHGAFRLENNFYWRAGFTAGPGDTLAGDLRVIEGRRLSRFIWLDAANFQRFRSGESYTAVFEQAEVPELSLRRPVAVADSFYLVFLNVSGSPVEVWARFALEQ